MSFSGISSSLAGAEPGRSGFPASNTSLLDYPPAPRLGGLFGPLSGGVSLGQAGGRWQLCKPGLGRSAARDHTSAKTHHPSAVASAGVKMGALQSPRQRPFEPGSRHRSRWSNDPAALDLPKGALSPWVSASVTCPGVRTSSPRRGLLHDWSNDV